jgi:phospholipid/cholesterol/gamma-HCH transport system substrate-binding protein
MFSSIKRRFDLVPGQHQSKAVRNGVIFTVIVAAVMYMGYTGSVPIIPSSATEVRADFPAAPQLRRNAPVRVQGVEVGRVKKVERTPDGDGARVTMNITDKDIKIHRDARAHVYWRTLLSKSMYVAIEPGSKGSGDLPDDLIPIQRTDAQTEFDQLVTPLKANAREGARGFLKAFDEGFDKDGARNAIKALGPAARPLGPAMQALRGTQTGDLGTLVHGANRALGALARESENLGGAVDNGAVALGATAAQSASLAQFVRNAPGALREIRATRPALTQTLDRLDPAADALRPGVRELGPTARQTTTVLRSLDRMLADTRPAVRALPPTARSLKRAAKAGVPLMERFDPTLVRMDKNIIPWLDKVEPATGLTTAEAIGPTFSAGASAAQQFDANGHQMRFQPGGGEHAIGSLPCETNFTDPTAKQAREKVACLTLRETFARLLGGSPQVPGVSTRRRP